MKLNYIYLVIGILTLVLNIILVLNLIRERKRMYREEVYDNSDIITFKLSRDNRSDNETTAAVQYEDTVAL